MSGGADQDQKTEQATEHHQAELRKEGRVAQSHDVVSAAALLASCAALMLSVHQVALDVMGVATRSLRLLDASSPFAGLESAFHALRGVMPILASACVAAVVAGVAQTKGLFSLELAMPKLERLDPMGRLAQMMPGKEMATELAKSLLKILTVGIVVYKIIDEQMLMLLSLSGQDARVAGRTVGEIAARTLMWAGGCFAIIAALDYWLALYKHNEQAKQTKQEQKEEHKQEEGNPLVKRKMRQRARELLSQAKAGDLKTATVIVTNPTHYAVALRYNPDKDAVPMVIAKALDAGALRMRTKARGYRIPIVENRPLARALHKHGKIGRPIPAEMYRAVAGIIAHVLRLRAGART
jgi:flagellar biosynthetic protein FlhB